MATFLHEAESFLRSLASQCSQIQKFANFCIEKCVLQQFQLSKFLQKYYIQGDTQMRTNIILILGQILIISHQKGLKSFTRAFAQKFKFFIDEAQYLQMSSKMASSILIQIQKCEQNKIFATSFFQKIKESSSKIAEKLSLIGQDGKFQPNYLKYSKTFLMKIQDIMVQKDLQNIYNTYCLHFELQYQANPQSQSQSLANNSQHQKLEVFPKNNDQIQDQKVMKVQKLQNIVIQCHVHILNLRQKLKQQLNMLICSMEQDQKAFYVQKMNGQGCKVISALHDNSRNDKSLDSLVYPFDD